MNRIAATVALALAAGYASGETVFVKYRGVVDLAAFRCEWVDRSSLVDRLCYDASNRYAIVSLKGTYYHYCRMPGGVVAAWREAPSMGRFYLHNVKGEFDCRLGGVPNAPRRE